MYCPSCGAPMNRHAEKTIKDPQVPEGEVIASIYCCPKCGKVEAEIEPQDQQFV
jgi:C4-type Zn-finger protein